jgi:hypothetical protein
LSAVERDDTRAVQVVKSAGKRGSYRLPGQCSGSSGRHCGRGLGLAGGLYWSSFVKSTRDHIWAEAARTLPILPAMLGNDAGLIGAAAAVLQRPV